MERETNIVPVSEIISSHLRQRLESSSIVTLLREQKKALFLIPAISLALIFVIGGISTSAFLKKTYKGEK